MPTNTSFQVAFFLRLHLVWHLHMSLLQCLSQCHLFHMFASYSSWNVCPDWSGSPDYACRWSKVKNIWWKVEGEGVDIG